VANAEAAPETPDATTIVDTQPPASPAIAALPSFTPGTARAMTWSSQAATGAVSYRVQVSLTDDFAVIALDSDWLADDAHFTGLADGSRYAYRAQPRDEAGNARLEHARGQHPDASAPATAVERRRRAHSFDVAWQGSDARAVSLHRFMVEGWRRSRRSPAVWTTSLTAFDAAAGGDGRTPSTIGMDAVGNAETARHADAAITSTLGARGAQTPRFRHGRHRAPDSWDAERRAFSPRWQRRAFALVAESGGSRARRTLHQPRRRPGLLLPRSQP
jgi:hypothetical protein